MDHLDQGSALSGWIEYGFKGLITIVCMLGAFLWKTVVDDMKALQKQQDESYQRLFGDLAAHKLDAEKRFAKEETMQASLGRIHDRIDEIGSDIKVLIGRVGSKK